jgi:lysophospholipase L1-like esterase
MQKNPESLSVLKIIRINFLVLIGILLFIEITGQLIFLVKWKHFMFSDPESKYRNLVFRRHPYLAVTLNKNVKAAYAKDQEIITTTEIGTRWTGADLNDTSKIRVACLGGSTTFCTYVNDEDSWPALLQKKLGNKFAVINYGVPGYSTVEAIIQMALLVPEKKPAIVIFYEGWNDIHNYYEPGSYPDYYKHGMNHFQDILGRKDHETLFEIFRRNSGFFYVIDNIRERIVKEIKPVLHSTPDKIIDNLYVRNLKTLKSLSLSQNSFPVFIPQIINPEMKRTADSSRYWTRCIDDATFPILMHRFNHLMTQVCGENDSSCCFFGEMETKVEWKQKDFTEDGHFSKEGNAVFSTMLAAKIKSICGN